MLRDNGKGGGRGKHGGGIERRGKGKGSKGVGGMDTRGWW